MLGEPVSHYRIDKKLGQGGMGIVFLAEDLKAVEEGVKGWVQPTGRAYFLGLDAVAQNLETPGERGRAVFLEAMADPRLNGPHTSSNVCLLYGELLLASPEPDPTAAEASFREAIAIAQRQQARSDGLSATTRLARLLKDQGRVPKARDRLSEIYGWFTEGFGLPYLEEAKTLLEELEGVGR